MGSKNVDLLLVCNVTNVAYLTGSASFDHSWTMQFSEAIAYPSIVIVPKAGQPILIVHDVFEGVLGQANAIRDIRKYYEKGQEEEQPYVEMIVKAVKELGSSSGTLAVELGAGYTTDPKLGMPIRGYLAIKDKLTNAKFVDNSEILRNVRMVKSNEELACIKKASEAIDKTFQICFETINEGITETEVVDVCNRIISENGARPIWTLAQCSDYHKVLSPRADIRLEKGKLLFLDLGAAFAGYQSDFNRMAVVGKASQAQKKSCQTIADITMATAQSVKPGIRACDLTNICGSEYARLGLKPPPGLSGYGPNRKIGHGIGLQLSEAPQITTYDRTVLQPGMTFCIEPEIVTAGGPYVTEQVVAVTEDGYEIISKADDQLYEI